mgnify:FL=1
MFKKVLIANRGEIALRILRACRELDIKTVAIHSEADETAMHVRMADESVCVGPASAQSSYLNIPAIITAATISNADAIHPGYGFLSENSKFSQICQEHKIKFIGASPEMIDKMGDKSSAKETMKKAGIPTIPGSEGIVESLEDAQKIAQKIGYPIMLKASAGGGGKGMRVVRKAKDLLKAWEDARQESKASFDNDDMYIEKFIENPRHIEIQIIGDRKGDACHLSERDCSIQRRHQKLIEETPSPFMTEKLRNEMGDAAVKAAKSVKYEGAGTIEFLVDKNRKFYFMEMNTRIQVEHPITEQVIDYDLIREQIKVANGDLITGNNYFPKLCSIECRINAEDPFNDFMPNPGRILNLHLPGGHGVRVDTHVYSGYLIPPHYDSMIAKLITTAQTREEAITKMQRALDEFIIEGVKTTIPFHQKVMSHPDFVSGKYTTKFMDTFEM